MPPKYFRIVDRFLLKVRINFMKMNIFCDEYDNVTPHLEPMWLHDTERQQKQNS